MKTLQDKMQGEIADQKTVEWAYPTSPNAVSFKMPNGCWCVELIKLDKNGCPRPPKTVWAFETRDEALDCARNSLLTKNIPWATCFKRCHPQDCL